MIEVYISKVKASYQTQGRRYWNVFILMNDVIIEEYTVKEEYSIPQLYILNKIKGRKEGLLYSQSDNEIIKRVCKYAMIHNQPVKIKIDDEDWLPSENKI